MAVRAWRRPAGAGLAAQRPYRRAILVEAPVSSMNTSRSGSRSSCPSNQASRAALTSGRSRSQAWAVFFDRDRPRVEEAPERADAS